jgi:hypothetical protein
MTEKETVKDKPQVKIGKSNKEYSGTNEQFRELCEQYKVDPTTRQASKYRNKKGKLYNLAHTGRKIILNDTP